MFKSKGMLLLAVVLGLFFSDIVALVFDVEKEAVSDFTFPIALVAIAILIIIYLIKKFRK